MKLILALYSNKIKCKTCQSKFLSVDKESVAQVNAGIFGVVVSNLVLILRN